jgi:aspartyl protease family protein
LARAGDGHFYVEADINGTSLKMLADTGASLVVLGEQAAEEVGINPDSLDYDQVVGTANGTAEAAVVELDEVRVGGIVRRDVKALVTRRLQGALLGMSFFNSLSKVSIESDELVLKD